MFSRYQSHPTGTMDLISSIHGYGKECDNQSRKSRWCERSHYHSKSSSTNRAKGKVKTCSSDYAIIPRRSFGHSGSNFIQSLPVLYPRGDISVDVEVLNDCLEISGKEVTFLLDFSITVKSSKDKFESQMGLVCKALSALLNSTGGKFNLNSMRDISSKEIDAWKGKLLDRLQNFISHETIFECIEMENVGSVGLMIAVKPSAKLVTFCSNMYTRSGHGTHLTRSSEICSQVICQSVSLRKPHGLKMEDMRYGDRVEINEGRNIEYKYFDVKGFTGLATKMTWNSTTEKCLMAFPNIPGGGDLFIGIKEEMGSLVVIGQTMSECEETEFTKIIKAMMHWGGTGKERIWGNESVKRNDYWSVRFYRVKDTPCGHRRVIVHISVDQVNGGLFASKPESYRLKDGRIQALSFTEWKLCVLHNK